MKETVDWLQSKAHLITYVGANSLKEVIHGQRNSKWEVALTNPCTLELRSTSQLGGSRSQAGGNKNKSHDKSKRDGVTRWAFEVDPPQDPTVVTIPLSSLNPQKTGMTVFHGDIFTGGNVFVGTTDDKETIIWRGADKTFNAKSIIIGFDQEGLPERVKKALSHAISLCGGEVNKKEPF
jgi:hypothetical protein